MASVGGQVKRRVDGVWFAKRYRLQLQQRPGFHLAPRTQDGRTFRRIRYRQHGPRLRCGVTLRSAVAAPVLVEFDDSCSALLDGRNERGGAVLDTKRRRTPISGAMREHQVARCLTARDVDQFLLLDLDRPAERLVSI